MKRDLKPYMNNDFSKQSAPLHDLVWVFIVRFLRFHKLYFCVQENFDQMAQTRRPIFLLRTFREVFYAHPHAVMYIVSREDILELIHELLNGLEVYSLSLI